MSKTVRQILGRVLVSMEPASTLPLAPVTERSKVSQPLPQDFDLGPVFERYPRLTSQHVAEFITHSEMCTAAMPEDLAVNTLNRSVHYLAAEVVALRKALNLKVDCIGPHIDQYIDDMTTALEVVVAEEVRKHNEAKHAQAAEEETFLMTTNDPKARGDN